MVSPLLLLLCAIICARADLVVNVRNLGGESYKQTIKANLTDETVVLFFDSYDGSSTHLIIDFKNEIQIIRNVRLGDQEEFDENGKKRFSVYKSNCFVTKFKTNEFIPVDAMAKLRQKNPWSLRTPERTEVGVNSTFDIILDATACDWISPMISKYCVSNDSAVTTTYAIKSDISGKDGNVEEYLRAVRDTPSISNSCHSGSNSECVCLADICIGWYPCALKFCRARNNQINNTQFVTTPGIDNFKTYRCGIHTCRVCKHFSFVVNSFFHCL